MELSITLYDYATGDQIKLETFKLLIIILYLKIIIHILVSYLSLIYYYSRYIIIIFQL